MYHPGGYQRDDHHHRDDPRREPLALAKRPPKNTKTDVEIIQEFIWHKNYLEIFAKPPNWLLQQPHSVKNAITAANNIVNGLQKEQDKTKYIRDNLNSFKASVSTVELGWANQLVNTARSMEAEKVWEASKVLGGGHSCWSTSHDCSLALKSLSNHLNVQYAQMREDPDKVASFVVASRPFDDVLLRVLLATIEAKAEEKRPKKKTNPRPVAAPPPPPPKNPRLTVSTTDNVRLQPTQQTPSPSTISPPFSKAPEEKIKIRHDPSKRAMFLPPDKPRPKDDEKPDNERSQPAKPRNASIEIVAPTEIQSKQSKIRMNKGHLSMTQRNENRVVLPLAIVSHEQEQGSREGNSAAPTVNGAHNRSGPPSANGNGTPHMNGNGTGLGNESPPGEILDPKMRNLLAGVTNFHGGLDTLVEQNEAKRKAATGAHSEGGKSKKSRVGAQETKPAARQKASDGGAGTGSPSKVGEKRVKLKKGMQVPVGFKPSFIVSVSAMKNHPHYEVIEASDEEVENEDILDGLSIESKVDVNSMKTNLDFLKTLYNLSTSCRFYLENMADQGAGIRNRFKEVLLKQSTPSQQQKDVIGSLRAEIAGSGIDNNVHLIDKIIDRFDISPSSMD